MEYINVIRQWELRSKKDRCSYSSKMGGRISSIDSKKKGGMGVYWWWVATVLLGLIVAVIKYPIKTSSRKDLFSSWFWVL